MNLVTSKKSVRSSTDGGMALPSGIRLYLSKEGWSSLVKIGVNFNALGTIMGTVLESGKWEGRPTVSQTEYLGSLPTVRGGKRIFLDIVDLETYVTRNKTTYV